MNSMIQRAFLVLLLASLGGCATFRGAPDLPFESGKVFGKDETQNALKKLASSDPDFDVAERNGQVIKLIAAIDLGYGGFKQQFMAQRQHVGSLSDALILAMTVAGSLTNSAGVKEHYLQGIALVRGGTENYDKNYLLTQTVHALVAQMDASRKQKLQEIYEKMTNSNLVQYPAIAAYNDVLDYYHAGTVLGAILSIQADAKQKENEANALLSPMLTSDKIMR